MHSMHLTNTIVYVSGRLKLHYLRVIAEVVSLAYTLIYESENKFRKAVCCSVTCHKIRCLLLIRSGQALVMVAAAST